MSGTESIGTLILFLGIIIALGVLFPAFSSFAESVSESIDTQIDTNREIQNTRIDINATKENNDLVIDVNNTGTEAIFLEDVTILLDGEVRQPDIATVDGSGKDIFYAGERLLVEFEDESANRVKVIVQKGISRIDTKIEVV